MPTLTEIDPIAKTLGNILAGEPVTHGALTLIPILAPLLAEPAWLTLGEGKEALAQLLGQRFLEAGVESDDLLWNRNVTLQPAAPDKRKTEPRGAAGDPATDPV